MRATSHAVLIADVVRSTALSDRLRSALTSRLRTLSRLHLSAHRIRLPYVVTAGDEFQTLASAPGQVPTIIFELRRLFRPLVLRIGVGIGQIPGRIVAPVNLMTGEAFLLARRALESVQDSTAHGFDVLTALRAKTPDFNRIANTIYGLHDTLVQNITERQWQTINMYLKTTRVDLTARALGVNRSTVSRNLKRGYLHQLQETIATMTELINGQLR
jgi:hypothetical protein